MTEPTRVDARGLGGYVAASLTAASRAAWSDDHLGNAIRFLVQDLGEFAETMVAAARAGYWSPVKAMERLFLERVQVLMGAGIDPAVCRRYLDSVLKPAVAARPLRPGRKARPEDAFDVFVDSLGSERGVEARKLWVDILASASDWFVHPTVMGPMLSYGARADPAESVPHWVLLFQVLSQGCIFTIVAAAKRAVTLDVEIIRALSGAAQYCIENGHPEIGNGILALHEEMAQHVVAVPPPAPAERRSSGPD